MHAGCPLPNNYEEAFGIAHGPPRSARIAAGRHTHRPSTIYNPRCACAPIGNEDLCTHSFAY